MRSVTVVTIVTLVTILIYMRTTKQILPGVKEIGWVRCEHLVNDIALRGISMMPVPILTEIHNVPLFDDPSCDCIT